MVELSHITARRTLFKRVCCWLSKASNCMRASVCRFKIKWNITSLEIDYSSATRTGYIFICRHVGTFWNGFGKDLWISTECTSSLTPSSKQLLVECQSVSFRFWLIARCLLCLLDAEHCVYTGSFKRRLVNSVRLTSLLPANPRQASPSHNQRSLVLVSAVVKSEVKKQIGRQWHCLYYWPKSGVGSKRLELPA